jgi:hypothetical protein
LTKRCNGEVQEITVSHPKPYFPNFVATIVVDGCTKMDIEELDIKDFE